MTSCNLRVPMFAASLLALAAWGLPGCSDSPSSARRRPGEESVDPTVAAAVDHLYDSKEKTTPAAAKDNAATKAGTPAQPQSPRQPSTEKVTASTTGTAKTSAQFPGEPLVMLSGADAIKVVAPKANSLNPKLLAGNKEKVVPRKIEVLVKEHKFVSDEPGGSLRVLYEDLDLLRVINMDPVTEDCLKYMPAWLRDLNGKKVRIRGYMAAGFLETGITNFVMARDTQACCFGPNTKIYHLIEVGMKPGLTAEYLPLRPLEVEGTFRIEPGALDGQMFHLYFIDNAEVVSKK